MVVVFLFPACNSIFIFIAFNFYADFPYTRQNTRLNDFYAYPYRTETSQNPIRNIFGQSLQKQKVLFFQLSAQCFAHFGIVYRIAYIVVRRRFFRDADIQSIINGCKCSRSQPYTPISVSALIPCKKILSIIRPVFC